jgi:hypothetical protein
MKNKKKLEKLIEGMEYCTTIYCNDQCPLYDKCTGSSTTIMNMAKKYLEELHEIKYGKEQNNEKSKPH